MAALPRTREQATFDESGQVLAGRRWSHSGEAGELTGWSRSVVEQREEDRYPSGFGEELPHGGHAEAQGRGRPGHRAMLAWTWPGMLRRRPKHHARARGYAPAMDHPIDEPREERHRIESPHAGLRLSLRHLRPRVALAMGQRAVLYVHGGTFSSGLSVAYRFDGRSWRDELCDAGYDVWALDFHGFGVLSDPQHEMNEPAELHAALGRADDASRQIEAAVGFILGQRSVERVSLIAHSWGTMAAGRFAVRHPDRLERLVLFAPITRRPGRGGAPRLPAWGRVSLHEQWTRFVADTPNGEDPAVSKRHFDLWGEHFLDGDPGSRALAPPAVKVPLGPLQDIYDAWAGELPYAPGFISSPVCIVRGATDSMCTDADAKWLFDELAASPIKRDVKLGRGGHLMHLEEGRYALYREALTFLAGGDTVPVAPRVDLGRARPTAGLPEV